MDNIILGGLWSSKSMNMMLDVVLKHCTYCAVFVATKCHKQGVLQFNH